MSSGSAQPKYGKTLRWLIIFTIVIMALVLGGGALGLVTEIAVDLGIIKIDIRPQGTPEKVSPIEEEHLEDQSIQPTLGVYSATAGCPYDNRGFVLMPYMGYGPLYGYFISRDYMAFHITDPNFFQTFYPAPNQANTWITLNGTPFDVCMDALNVYARPNR